MIREPFQRDKRNSQHYHVEPQLPTKPERSLGGCGRGEDRSIDIRKVGIHQILRRTAERDLLPIEPGENVFDKNRESVLQRKIRRAEVESEHQPLRVLGDHNQRCFFRTRNDVQVLRIDAVRALDRHLTGRDVAQDGMARGPGADLRLLNDPVRRWQPWGAWRSYNEGGLDGAVCGAKRSNTSASMSGGSR